LGSQSVSATSYRIGSFTVTDGQVGTQSRLAAWIEQAAKDAGK